MLLLLRNVCRHTSVRESLQAERTSSAKVVRCSSNRMSWSKMCASISSTSCPVSSDGEAGAR